MAEAQPLRLGAAQARRGFLATLLHTAGVAGLAHAESLADAITAAYQSNPNIQAQRAAMRALDENYTQARAAYGLQGSAQQGGVGPYQRQIARHLPGDELVKR